MDHSTLKQILTAFFSLYFVILVVLYFFGPSSSVNQRELPELTSTEHYIPEEEETTLRFNNPRMAYEVISQLEILPDLAGFKPETLPQKPFTNLKTDDNYCEKRRAFFVLHPEAIFEEMAYLSDNPPTSLVREKMLKPLGVDVQPYIGSHMAKEDDTMYDISPEVTNFHSRLIFYGGQKLGRHFSCLSQISNHVPGRIVMGKKFAMTEAALAYGEQYQNRPQCFQVDKFMPKTYLLYRKDDCETFFKILDSPEYKALKNNQTIVFLKKAGEAMHMGAGVDPVNDEEEASLRATYDNGRKCGKVNDLSLIQKYIPNPLLIQGRKFDFRFYVMIASTNPLIAYYHDGTLRVSLMQYDANSTDKKTLLTNIALNKDIYDNAKDGKLFNNMTEDELKTAQQWTFSRFEKYLLDSGVITDPAWFDNYLRPQFKKAMIHLLRFGLVAPTATSSVYDLYGLDFMLDTDFNVWFIEANSAPGMGRFSEPVENFVLKMLRDEMEIVMGLLRSRMKRVIKFVNELIDSGAVKEIEDGTVKIRGLEMNRMIFETITENYFEEEFMPSPGNGFAKIIDGNYNGAERYMGFVSKECL